MAYTTHGYQIPGSPAGTIQELPKNPFRCGGINVCPRCTQEADEWESINIGEPTDFQAKAKRIVKDYVDSLHRQHFPGTDLPTYEVYVVWFTKALQNWKAILGTTMADSRLFEVTYDGNRKSAYVDAYRKTDNFTVYDHRV